MFEVHSGSEEESEKDRRISHEVQARDVGRFGQEVRSNGRADEKHTNRSSLFGKCLKNWETSFNLKFPYFSTIIVRLLYF